jgi:hypothetical protein
MELIITILKEGFLGSAKSIIQIAVIVIPLIIIMQIAKDFNIIDKITPIFNPISTVFGIKKEASFPLIIGIIFGLTYGAGFIIQSVEEGILNKKDIFLVTAFLCLCHAIFEDTLIFVAIGGNGLYIITIRLILTFSTIYLISRVINKSEKNKTTTTIP